MGLGNRKYAITVSLKFKKVEWPIDVCQLPQLIKVYLEIMKTLIKKIFQGIP
jgi:hypothetical protein